MPYEPEEYTGGHGTLKAGDDVTILSVKDWKAKENCDWKDSTKFESLKKKQSIPGNKWLDITFELMVNKSQLAAILSSIGGLGIRTGEFVEDLILDDGEALVITCPVVAIKDVQYGTPQADECKMTVTAMSEGDYTIAVHGTPPVANFTGTPRSGANPLTVTFTDTSTNTPTAWLWDFGDDEISALQNPVHIYADEGIYTVKLKATNADGSSIKIKEDYITAT